MDNLTEEPLERAQETITSDLINATIVDNNGNKHPNIKTELTENENDVQQLKRSSKKDLLIQW